MRCPDWARSIFRDGCEGGLIMLLNQLIDALLSPLRFGLLLALALYLLRTHVPRGLWWAGLALESVCVALTTSAGANILVAIEERRAAPVVCAAPEPTALVLLAGGLRRVPRDAQDIGALNDASVQRTLVAAQLVRQLSAAELVISGSSRPGDDVAESTLMAVLARRLGVPTAAIRVEVGAQTTWENAQDVRALVPALPQKIWLVTSALHMPRSLIAFHAAGFEPCAWPSDFRASPLREFADLLPSGGAATRTEMVLHELAGELAYRWHAARQ